MEAVVIVEACTDTAVVGWWWASVATCSPPAPVDTRLTGLLVSTDRFWGFRKSGVVTRLGPLPPDVLANSRLLPSSEVMGMVPLEASAAEEAEFVIGEWGLYENCFICVNNSEADR